MSVTAMVQEWLYGLGEREASAVTSRAHISAEMNQDLDRICGTIAPDPFFAVPTRTAAGYEIDDTNVLTTYDAVGKYYSDRMDGYLIVASRQLKSTATPWYVFNESVATLLGTGEAHGVQTRGVQYTVQAAVLFPTASDGIRGEIAVGRHPYADTLAGVSSAPERDSEHRVPADLGRADLIPLDEFEQAYTLDRITVGMAAGRADEIIDALAENHCMAVRVDDVNGKGATHIHTDADSSGRTFATFLEGARYVTLMARISTSWYSFAEYLMQLDGGIVRRLALIHAAHNGRLIGTFGFGREDAGASI